MAIEIVLADDHPIVLVGLTQLFGLEPDLRLVEGCLDGARALEAVRRHRPSVLILDIRMPDLDGLAVLRAIREEQLPTRVVLLTAALDDDETVEAIRLGACGVVLKEAAPSQLVQCVRRVHAGERPLDPAMVLRALDQVVRRDEVAGTLTVREMEITRLAGVGRRNREIAGRLGISEGTVKLHLHNIYEKLRLDGRYELMHYATSKGLV
jgi:DNA-binding NarL/FixJ family response regulator